MTQMTNLLRGATYQLVSALDSVERLVRVEPFSGG